jgi:hypothetical protein
MIPGPRESRAMHKGSRGSAARNRSLVEWYREGRGTTDQWERGGCPPEHQVTNGPLSSSATSTCISPPPPAIEPTIVEYGALSPTRSAQNPGLRAAPQEEAVKRYHEEPALDTTPFVAHRHRVLRGQTVDHRASGGRGPGAAARSDRRTGGRGSGPGWRTRRAPAPRPDLRPSNPMLRLSWQSGRARPSPAALRR